MATSLTLKNMKAAYVKSGCDDDVWKALYTLHCVGMIDRETWSKFFEQCQGYTRIEDGRIIDIKFIDGKMYEREIH